MNSQRPAEVLRISLSLSIFITVIVRSLCIFFFVRSYFFKYFLYMDGFLLVYYCFVSRHTQLNFSAQSLLLLLFIQMYFNRTEFCALCFLISAISLSLSIYSSRPLFTYGNQMLRKKDSPILAKLIPQSICLWIDTSLAGRLCLPPPTNTSRNKSINLIVRAKFLIGLSTCTLTHDTHQLSHLCRNQPQQFKWNLDAAREHAPLHTIHETNQLWKMSAEQSINRRKRMTANAMYAVCAIFNMHIDWIDAWFEWAMRI